MGIRSLAKMRCKYNKSLLNIRLKEDGTTGDIGGEDEVGTVRVEDDFEHVRHLLQLTVRFPLQ